MSDERTIYPPPQHLLRDLRIVVDRVGQDVVARLDPSPQIADPTGRTRVGVLATLVDVIAGEAAIRSVLPNWTATSNLAVYVDEIPQSDPIEATSRVLRSGRQTVVLEVELRSGREGREIGVAQIGFAILAARNDLQSSRHWAEAPEARTDFATPTSGLRKPILETIGLVYDLDDPSISWLPGVPPYLINSLGALQGGAVAILVDAAAEHFATARLGGSVRVRSLVIQYLRLGRVGPIRAECRPIARTTGGLLVHVALFDEGADDALLTVATIQVDEASPVT